MRILYVAPLNSIHSVRWISYFAGIGHDVHVLDAAFADSRDVEGITVHRVPLEGSRMPVVKYLIRFPRWVTRLRGLVASIRPDVIHIHWLGLHALGVAFIGFHPLIVTPWGSDLLVVPKGSVKRGYLVRRILEAGTAFVCDADHIREELVRRRIPRDRIHVIYFGTDVDRFHPRRRDRRLAIELGFTETTPLVISLRSLESIYDVATLIAAVPTISKRCPEARFVIVGDGPERMALEQQARTLGVDMLVRFVGRLSDDDLVRYTASASVYVSTSLSDAGLSASTAEAMACGVPPVVTDFGDNGAWVVNGRSGFLFRSGDPAALANRLITLLSDLGLADRLGSAARQVIVERNNKRLEMEKMDQLYGATIQPSG